MSPRAVHDAEFSPVRPHRENGAVTAAGAVLPSAHSPYHYNEVL
jgi:hypothetical protein